MKDILAIIGFTLLTVGLLVSMMVATERENRERRKNNRYVEVGNSFPVKVQVIEGCEYLTPSVNGGISISHKGNCTNSIHKCN